MKTGKKTKSTCVYEITHDEMSRKVEGYIFASLAFAFAVGVWNSMAKHGGNAALYGFLVAFILLGCGWWYYGRG